MQEKTTTCSCKSNPTTIFPCSGAADVGELADRTARALTKDGVGKIFCLAGIGGGVSGIIESAKAADQILAIDGCPLDCAKKTLEKAGFSSFKHVRITDMGFKKGSTEITSDSLSSCVQKCKESMCSQKKD